MYVPVETARVYRGGRRRWLTKKAAYWAAARQRIQELRCDCEKPDFHPYGYPGNICEWHRRDIEEQYSCIGRLATIYESLDRSKSVPLRSTGGYVSTKTPTPRNHLNIGDKVLMKAGEVLTVKSLEFREFVSHERVGYISKRDIVAMLNKNTHNGETVWEWHPVGGKWQPTEVTG